MERAVEAAARDMRKRMRAPSASWDAMPVAMRAVRVALRAVADYCDAEAMRESEASARLPAVDQQALGAIVAYRELARECRETTP